MLDRIEALAVCGLLFLSFAAQAFGENSNDSSLPNNGKPSPDTDSTAVAADQNAKRVSTSSISDDDLKKMLCAYPFIHNARDAVTGRDAETAKNLSFDQNAMYLNGQYPYSTNGQTAADVRARVPALNYSAFAVAFWFNPSSVEEPAIISGGPSYRWFGLDARKGDLEVTANNRQFLRKFDGAPINSREWNLVVCSWDLNHHEIALTLNGSPVDALPLPANFKSEIIGTEFDARDRIFCFVNYASGMCFRGFVRDLRVYPASLSKEDVRGLTQKMWAAKAELPKVVFPADDVAAPVRDLAGVPAGPAKSDVLSVGNKTTPFKATKMDGSSVNFPADYKGKIVMLDFWATWCGPCMGEVPGLVKTYNDAHARGFEILGISLDQANAAEHVKGVTAQKGMTWPQVYDGKFWKAEVADLYGIESIPKAFLINGDTGEILATGDSLRGESLARTIQDALANRGGPSVHDRKLQQMLAARRAAGVLPATHPSGMFWYTYVDGEPRLWLQTNDTHWGETYPDAHTTSFLIVKTITDGETPGIVVRRQPDDGFEVLIPPQDGQPLRFRFDPTEPWKSLGPIHLKMPETISTPAPSSGTQP